MARSQASWVVPMTDNPQVTVCSAMTTDDYIIKWHIPAKFVIQVSTQPYPQLE